MARMFISLFIVISCGESMRGEREKGTRDDTQHIQNEYIRNRYVYYVNVASLIVVISSPLI